MRDDISHLPPSKRAELQRIVEILFEEFQAARAGATQPWKKQGQILKVILFGSYARGDWVDRGKVGYQSDYDILVVVNDDRLTDVPTYWSLAENRLAQPSVIKRPVNLIVHSLKEVNKALRQGQYFFTDIIRDGIALYDRGGCAFDAPQPLNPQEALEIARGYFNLWFPMTSNRLRLFRFQRDHAEDEVWRRDAAFILHQATEAAYNCLLLTCTFYLPPTHNIKWLRSLALAVDPRFTEVWPENTRFESRCFELLKRAYVEARYSKHYKITVEELDWLFPRVEHLRDLVGEVCQEHLRKLEARAAVADGTAKTA